MQIVIDIPKEEYEYIKANHPYELFYVYGDAIRDGIPLPKHYGRLGDLDALYKEMENGIKAGNYENGYENYGHINNMDDCLEAVKYAETIIPATKEKNCDTCKHKDKKYQEFPCIDCLEKDRYEEGE